MCCVMAYCAGVVWLRGVAYPAWCFVPIGIIFLLSVLLANRRHAVSFWLAVVCFLGLGAVRGSMAWTPPAMPEFGNWVVEGTIDGAVRQDAEGARFYLAQARVVLQTGESVTLDSRVYVSCQALMVAELLHGQRVRVEGKSYAPRGQRNPGGFDQRLWLAENGAHVRMFSSKAPELMDPGGSSVLRFAIQVSRYLADYIDGVFGKAAPIVRAMLIGDQSEVSDEWYDWLRVSGVVHILAVSGLHVGLWYALIDWLLERLPVSLKERFALLALFLGAYALLTGLSPSVIRASVMLLAIQGGRIVKRRTDPLTALSLAALIILLFRPIDLLRPGFQLSFCAVLGIFLFRPFFMRFLRGPVWIRVPATVSLSAQLGALPALAYWFHRVSLLSVLANLLVVPIVGVLIPVSTLGLALSAIAKPLGWFFVESGKGMVAVILLIGRWVSSVRAAVMTVVPFAPWTIAAWCFCAVVASTATVWSSKKRLLAMAVALALAAGIGALQYDDTVRYVQLDVGEALSGVLHVGRKTYVYDCGGANSDLADYLLTTGQDVDGLFLSHPHMDHVGGLADLLSAGIRIRTIYVPSYANYFEDETEYLSLLAAALHYGAEIVEVAAGDTLDLNGLDASVLSPERGVVRGKNTTNRSLVLLIDIGGKKLLLCGDEDMDEPDGVACDVLQIAHHGSRIAAEESFIQYAMPEVALISVGGNPYGHPNPEMMDRVRATGAALYRTDESGAITVTFNPESLRVEVFCP